MSTPRFQLVPGGRMAGGGAGGVGWRLLGSNNRELGRSGGIFPDATAAHRAISALPAVIARGQAHVGHDAATGHWTWWLELGGERVAASGRGFRHERECRYNLQQFCEAAPMAPTSATAVPDQPSWRREHTAPAAGPAGVVAP